MEVTAMPLQSCMGGALTAALAAVTASAAAAEHTLPAPNPPLPAFLKAGAPFDLEAFREPPALLWPAVFWLWNDPLDPTLIRAQLADMAAHGVRSVCMLPMPHAFRPDSTNNGLTPDYLTPAFFDCVTVAIDEAARLGMHWWLYDEGGWPSGEACGEVTAGHPELAVQRLVREPAQPRDGAFPVPGDVLALVAEEGGVPRIFRPGETWRPATADATAWLYRCVRGGPVNRQLPAATARFIALTHEPYRQALGRHLGSTVLAAFTDEPSMQPVEPGRSLQWTESVEARYRERWQRDLVADLPLLFAACHGAEVPPAVAQARVRWYDLNCDLFRDGYFRPLRDWCREAGIASGGHLGGEDETINAVRHGFGSALRQLRALDIPGVDLIWRQLFPGRPNQHFFPKSAATAAHQNGTRYAFTESFAVYGNGLTLAQMKWLTDYQYVRGVNLMVLACYPLSTRAHHMTGERPHFGPTNPLWDHSRGYHAHVARLGYALSCGDPLVETALYYPVRDLWASGAVAGSATTTHDAIAQALLARQCDFDLIDDDLLAAADTRCEAGALVAGAMRYRTVIVGATRWLRPESLARLREFAGQDGQLVCLQGQLGVDGGAVAEITGALVVDSAAAAAAPAPALVSLMPASTGLRVSGRQLAAGRLILLFNEGDTPYRGELAAGRQPAYELETTSGTLRRARRAPDGGAVALGLEPGESVLLWLDAPALPAAVPLGGTGETAPLDAALAATPYRRFVVGEHDYEVRPVTGGTAIPFARAGRWADWLGADFSGEVDYGTAFSVPEAWAGRCLELRTGPVQVAATVWVDGLQVGEMAWPPWRVEIRPLAPGPHTLLIRVANTLANELTSERVVVAWAQKRGPGWPSPYHRRAIEFERDSCGGGLQGPVTLGPLAAAPMP